MITLSDLMQDRRELVVHLKNEMTMTVVYRPSAYTAAVEDEVLKALNQNRVLNALVTRLSSILLEWDLVDDKGKVLPVQPTLRQLPGEVLMAIMEAIIKDNGATDKETRKN